MVNQRNKTGLVIGALALAAVAVVAVLAWLTGSFPSEQQTSQSVTVEVVASPSPTEIPASPTPSPVVAGVTTHASTGPADGIFFFAAAAILLGGSGSVFLAKLG